MQNLYILSYRLIEETGTEFKRYLYYEIDWNDRLIIIKGPKGVGKTTLMLQHIKEAFAKDYTRAIFASLDHVWFSSHSILELAEYHYTHGGTHMFLDEIHKYPNWAQEIKNIYDYYPKMNIVATGSSILRLDASSNVDLSRRHVEYNLQGLSLREYMVMTGHEDPGPYSLDDILSGHVMIATKLCQKTKILPIFEKYLKCGYYPFFKESETKYYNKLQNSIVNVIEADLPMVGKLDYDSVHKIKRLLSIISSQTPYTLNIKELGAMLEVSRNTLVKMIDLLDRAVIIRKLYSSDKGLRSLYKPIKILLGDTNIMHSLSEDIDKGTLRESFAASQLSKGHYLLMPNAGDLLVDNKIYFEIGGKKKHFDQIKDIPDSFVLADDIEIGFGNKIPLWMIGLMY